MRCVSTGARRDAYGQRQRLRSVHFFDGAESDWFFTFALRRHACGIDDGLGKKPDGCWGVGVLNELMGQIHIITD